MSKNTYAVAVRDVDLRLLLTVVRASAGDIYVNWPRDMEDPNWKPHGSWHASGQYHHKSYNHKLLPVQQRQKPDASFTDTGNLVTTEARLASVHAVNITCNPAEFTDVIEIPAAELPLERQRMLSIDVTEPTAELFMPHSYALDFRWLAKSSLRIPCPG